MAESTTPPTDPTGLGPIEPSKGKSQNTPNQSQFKSYMEQPPSKPSTPSSQVSPIELSRGALPQGSTPTLESLLSQAETTHANFENVKHLLRTPNLRFKRSQESLLRTKLSEANTHVLGASQKLGAKVSTPKTASSGSGPVEKFLGLITNGESQLHEARETLLNLKDSEGELKPGDLLLVQVKLAQAQQNLEYASILLSKVIDVIKQMINIQL